VSSTKIQQRRHLIEDNDTLSRDRRLSGEPAVLSFYRPTKHMASSLADDHSLLAENKQKRHESTIDESLYTTVTKNTKSDKALR